MKIRIPRGEKCRDCLFDSYNANSFLYRCRLFETYKWFEEKLSECLQEFGDGGEFILIPDWWQARPRRKLTEKENKQLVKAMEKMFKEVK